MNDSERVHEWLRTHVRRWSGSELRRDAALLEWKIEEFTNSPNRESYIQELAIVRGEINRRED